MLTLLIISDDFTGALDTGVQFAARGAITSVITYPDFDFSSIDKELQVLVIDAETRHLKPESAYSVVRQIVEKALKNGVFCIYKKTDSALRGNVGAELTGVLDAAGADRLPFVPAFPKTGRVTLNGIHFIKGIPVAESVFGQDLFEPVRHSRVADILKEQSLVATVERRPGELGKDLPGIQIFDASTDDDLLQIGWQLGINGIRLCAGCAGFAAIIAELLALTGSLPQKPVLQRPFFVVCGSTNPVTRCQLDAAERAGFPRFRLSPEQKILTQWLEGNECKTTVKKWIQAASQKGCCILDSNDLSGSDTRIFAAEQGMNIQRVRERISNTLGQLMKKLLDNGLEATLMCTGGDTLLALMKAVGVGELTPVCELSTGVVLTKFNYQGKIYNIISKSGGFGDPELLCKLEEQTVALKADREEGICLRNTI